MNRRQLLATGTAAAIAGCLGSSDEQRDDLEASDTDDIEYELSPTCIEESGICMASLDITTMPDSIEYIEVKTTSRLGTSGSWITRTDDSQQELFIDREQPRGDVELAIGDSIIIQAVTTDGRTHVLEVHEFSQDDLKSMTDNADR